MNIHQSDMKLHDSVQGSAQSNKAGSTKITNTMIAEKQAGFNEILNAQLAASRPLQFSKHANMRLNSREISLTTEQVQRVEEGVNKALAKGIRDSLVFVDNVALVVNVRSKTVITAMQTSSCKEEERIFSNIDGAVIV